ncbi:hypothetical protein BK659_23145 [Pseudomonas brassicacearum]|uniref:DUF2474 domain-containing protein n=1 Tax=Pseudomonas brassicacearum TaxID=930166 RepID=A0A423GYF3_9PSED|nr:DUF2474 domain-containing protein [Pseudomonas brassicacearum]RON03406.1 hypothetical protein BK659_23145 [Pseudomonas brassicacearum]
MATIDSRNARASEESVTQNQSSPWYRRVLWLIAIWFGSVIALGAVASFFRLMMHMAGMTTH